VDELLDRFGEPPHPVRHLIEQHRIRLLAGRHGITYIARRPGFLMVKFTDATKVHQLFTGASNADGSPLVVRVVDADTLHLHYPRGTDSASKAAAFLRGVLQGQDAA